MKHLIYADNAATTKLDIDAFEAMKPFLLNEYANASQPYFFAKKARQALKDARETLAYCIGAEPEEIYFTSGGSESDNWAIKSFGIQGQKRRVITSEIEHHAVLHACRAGVIEDVVYLSVDSKGTVSPGALENVLKKKTANSSELETLVSIMLVNNEIGTIEPIKEVATLAHQYDALFHTDAVQAVGHIPVNVEQLGVDMLSASAHKFNGPKGVGFLYIRKGTDVTPYIDGGAQEKKLRAGTENVPAIVAMAKALKKNCVQMMDTEKKLRKMEEIFISELKSSKLDFICNGSDCRVPGNISISIRGASGEMLLHRLDLKGIAISTGSACDSENTQISHVIKAIKVPEEYAMGTIRVSFGRDNQISDAKAVAQAVIDVLS